ncbi:hypothetical protein SY88_17040 [Clostridiales bacterium PH28_bin88]|nr:hypothetical protein SY88_17040 [Clostridiales bacterium PH28_bin88]
MEEILANLGNYGFPMVVAAYLLVRVEKKLDTLTLAIKDLQQAIGYLYTGLAGPNPTPPRNVNAILSRPGSSQP